MTLSGHSQPLFKKIGDGVDTRGVLAQMGHNGEHRQAGVYIELR